jgi:hypothetical protein
MTYKKLHCGLCMKVGHEVIHVDFKKSGYCHRTCIVSWGVAVFGQD